MRELTVFNSLTLDGVMQAPGRPDEDTRGGFAHGGWAAPYMDEVIGRVAAQGMADAGPLLFGRRTYEDFYSFWPHQTGNPFTEVLDSSQKYVASRTKQEPGKDLTVLGSGELVQALRRHDLVDQYVLLLHPLVLGSGRRMFPDGGPYAELRLVDAVPTTTGVIIATYRPVTAGAKEGAAR